MEFTEVLEQLGREAEQVASAFQLGEQKRSAEGFSRVSHRRSRDPKYMRHLLEAAHFMDDLYTGRRSMWQFKEVMTRSDFPLLFGDIIDRQMLGRYASYTPSWQSYMKRGTVPDFRTVNRYAIDGGIGRLSAVAEQAPVPQRALTEARYQYAVTKYEAGASFSFEAWVNDDLDGLKSMPDRFSEAARRTEDYQATILYVDANGPHASFYTDTNNNRVNVAEGAGSNNPILSITSLQDALEVIARQVDAVEGEPIVIDLVTLVVPPALSIIAQNILNSTELRINVDGGATNAQLIVRNWMTNGIKLAINPYIPIVASTANGHTSWFLFASPSVGRPAIEFGFLRGYEGPDLFRRAPNAIRVGGGGGTEEFDFDTESIAWKVRHIMGGTRMDPKATVASNGSGA